jgi:Flp pilus assembly protein TadB
MFDGLAVMAAVAAGACVAVALAGLAGSAPVPEAVAWLQRRRSTASRPPRAVLPVLRDQAVVRGALERLAVLLDRAGRPEKPERLLALVAAAAAGVAIAAGGAGALRDPATAVALNVLGLGGTVLAILQRVVHGARKRRARLLAELAPTLELMSLELSGGNSPHGAIAAVTARTDGELSRELRRLLAAASVSSGGSFENRLAALAARLDLPPLAALAAVMATSRDYGSGVGQGVRALAVDLRRAQRREVIATSRRALTRVLLPAGVGVLLPFMAILLFPAVTTLAESFR